MYPLDLADQSLAGALDRRRLGQYGSFSIVLVSLYDQSRLLVRFDRGFAFDLVDHQRIELSDLAVDSLVVVLDVVYAAFSEGGELALVGFLEWCAAGLDDPLCAQF